MPLGLTFSFPVEQMVLDKHEKFISGMYLGKITRDTLLALVDAAPQPIIFGSKAPEQALRARRGGAQLRRDGGEKDYAAAALCPKRQDIVQEHFGYEPMRGLPARRSARRPPLPAAERVSHRDRRALDGLRHRAREGRAASSVVGVGGKLYAIGLDWSLHQHCPGFEECTRWGGGLRILLGEEVENYDGCSMGNE
ncbi:hypothetical protein EDB83DRAFT_2314750 [Lactarius deliciosus]|nr:hypothetical protein EDB83DRAFT_2314750 [Lactarius deliciosus]